MRGKCERGHGSANADGAGAEAFAGDGYSQGASFGPMAAISRRGQGGRIYNNTRARVLLRRMCVKPADLTTHSPPKTSARPRTATRPSRALPLPHAAPTHARRLCDAFPAALTTHSPPKTFARPRTATRPSRALPLPHAAPTHTRRPHDPFPAEDLRSPPHSDTPFPSTSAPPRSPDARPRSPDACPQAVRCIPRRLHNPFPAEDLRPPPHSTHPPRALPLPHAAPTHAHRLCDAFPADFTTHSPQRHAASPSVPLRTQKNGTAQCMCDAECLGRPSLRSVIWVGEPRAVRRRCGALRVGVGLRPQPWALRSRRCGRVLRA